MTPVIVWDSPAIKKFTALYFSVGATMRLPFFKKSKAWADAPPPLLHVIVAGMVSAVALTLAQLLLVFPLLALVESESLFGLARFSQTLIANLATGLTFALLIYGFLYILNHGLSFQRAVHWGLALWLAVFFLPAMNFPAVLPQGSEEVHDHHQLFARQFWTIAIALSAGLGFFLHHPRMGSFITQYYAIALTILLLLVPSIWAGKVMEGIVVETPFGAIYAVRSLMVSFIFVMTLLLMFALPLGGSHVKR